MSILSIKATTLSDIEKFSKILKTDLIYINRNGLISGTDVDHTYIEFLDDPIFNGIPIPLILSSLELRKILKENKNEYIQIEYSDRYFLSDNKFTLKSYIYLQSILDEMISKATSILSFIPSVELHNLELNDNFKILLKRKSSYGASHININGYNMYLFKSLFSINSSDTVDIKIYDDRNEFTALFDIRKKGVMTIHQFLRFIKI